MEVEEFYQSIEPLLRQKQEWFNNEKLQEVLSEYRILHACIHNLNELLIKKSLIHADPYRLDKRISDIVIPDTSPFPDTDTANQLGSRFSDYELMLDFLCTYYSFTVDSLNIPKIKKLLDFNAVVDWKNLYSNSSSSITRTLSNCLSSVRQNAPSVIISMINDCTGKSAAAVEKINAILNELGLFQRELYKVELRHDVFNHPEFNKQKAFTSPEEEVAEIKRLFGKVIGKRKPCYSELLQELANEDLGADKEKYRQAVLKRLEIKNVAQVAKKKKSNTPNSKKIIMDTVFCLGAIGPTLQQIYSKLTENFDVYYAKKKNFMTLLGQAFRLAFKIPEKERVCEVNIVDSQGISRSQKINVNEELKAIQQKVRIYSGIASKGSEYSKIENSDETAILNFLNKQVSECQSTFSKVNALDVFFKSLKDPLKRVKIKGMSLELSTLRASIINVNKKRSEYVSYKEETEQMKKLGISDND
ncbi:MAG: hypothetical protein K5866_06000 [Treponema sp.]|nr:hypothetical protein [Treponema sp.]